MPSDQMSARESYWSWRITYSGAIQERRAHERLALGHRVGELAATPKSASFTSPLSESSTFAALMSRPRPILDHAAGSRAP